MEAALKLFVRIDGFVIHLILGGLDKRLLRDLLAAAGTLRRHLKNVIGHAARTPQQFLDLFRDEGAFATRCGNTSHKVIRSCPLGCDPLWRQKSQPRFWDFGPRVWL